MLGLWDTQRRLMGLDRDNTLTTTFPMFFWISIRKKQPSLASVLRKRSQATPEKDTVSWSSLCCTGLELKELRTDPIPELKHSHRALLTLNLLQHNTPGWNVGVGGGHAEWQLNSYKHIIIYYIIKQLQGKKLWCSENLHRKVKFFPPGWGRETSKNSKTLFTAGN